MKILCSLLALLIPAITLGQGTITPNRIVIQGSRSMGSMPSGATNLHSIHASTGTPQGYPNISAMFGITSRLNESSIQSVEGYAYTGQTGTTTLSLGVIGNVEHGGSGTTTLMHGVQGGTYISGSGGGTDAAAFLAAPSGRIYGGTGTYTNGYGLYIGNFLPGFINKYGVYVKDATADNYFAGTVTIGSGKLYIENGALKFRGANGTITTLALP